MKVQGRTANQKPTFNQLLNKYTKAVQNDRPLKKRPRSPPRQDRPASPRRESSRRRGDVVTLYPPQKMYATMPWMPPASNATNPAWEHGGIWMQCFPMPYPPHYQGESSRMPVHDRLGPRQSGPGQQVTPVRPVHTYRSDRSHQRPGQAPVPRFEYRVKEKREEQKTVADSEKFRADVVVQIGEIKVPIKDTGKKSMDIDTSVDVPSQKPVMANDHEAGSSKSTADKYHQPRWCPSGLTHTQKRKLQRLRNKEKKEQEKEKMRDEEFNRYRPMFPQSKVWKAKTADQPDRPVGPPQLTGQTGQEDQSDRLNPVQRQQPNRCRPFRFLLLMKPHQFL